MGAPGKLRRLSTAALDPIRSPLLGRALVKIAVVELCQFRKSSFVKHPHPPPVDIESVLVAQLFDDPVDVHGLIPGSP